jgi:hypothetical protein
MMSDPITQLGEALATALPDTYEVRRFVNAMASPVRADLAALLMIDAPSYTPPTIGGAGYLLDFPVHILVPATSPAAIAESFALVIDEVLTAVAGIPGITWSSITPDQFDDQHPSNIVHLVAMGGIDIGI